jgi:pimeloyl-ACP methyl ester carboxylesterase
MTYKKTLYLGLLFVTALLHAQIQTQPEDWTKLAVTRSQFAPTSPIEAGVQTQPGFTRELLQVEWRGGDPIDLYIVRPANVVKPPVVLFLYSWPTDTDTFRNDAWCINVTRHSFAAVGFVSALTGHRYHSRPWKESFVSELPEALGKSVHDVQLLLDYLATRNDLDITRAGMFGQGSGGTIALLAASVDPRLKAIDVIDPWADWPDWFHSSPLAQDGSRPEYVTAAFLEKAAPFDPTFVSPKMAQHNVRLEQTVFNPSVPIAARERLRNVWRDKATYILYANEEQYRSQAMSNGQILDWLQARLGQSVPDADLLAPPKETK